MCCKQLLEINNKDIIGITDDRDLPICIYSADMNRRVPVVFGYRFDSIRCATFDPDTRLLFVAQKKWLRAINVDNPSHPVIHQSLSLNNTMVSRMILIGDHLHIIGYSTGTSTRQLEHAILDKHTLQCKNRPQVDIDLLVWDGWDWMYNLHLLHLHSRNSIVVFGHDQHCNGRIYEFALSTNQWTASFWLKPLTLRMTMAMVSTHDGRYMFYFGGWMEDVMGGDATRKITICDVKQRVFMEKEVDCLGHGYQGAVMVADKHRDEIITFGFVNRVYKTRAFCKVQTFPVYLTQLIAKWAVREFIYVTTSEINDCVEHNLVRIRVDGIFQ